MSEERAFLKTAAVDPSAEVGRGSRVHFLQPSGSFSRRNIYTYIAWIPRRGSHEELRVLDIFPHLSTVHLITLRETTVRASSNLVMRPNDFARKNAGSRGLGNTGAFFVINPVPVTLYIEAGQHHQAKLAPTLQHHYCQHCRRVASRCASDG